MDIGFVDLFYVFWIQKSHHFYDYWIQNFFWSIFTIFRSRNCSISAVQFLDPEIVEKVDKSYIHIGCATCRNSLCNKQDRIWLSHIEIRGIQKLNLLMLLKNHVVNRLWPFHQANQNWSNFSGLRKFPKNTKNWAISSIEVFQQFFDDQIIFSSFALCPVSQDPFTKRIFEDFFLPYKGVCLWSTMP